MTSTQLADARTPSATGFTVVEYFPARFSLCFGGGASVAHQHLGD